MDAPVRTRCARWLAVLSALVAFALTGCQTEQPDPWTVGYEEVMWGESEDIPVATVSEPRRGATDSPFEELPIQPLDRAGGLGDDDMRNRVIFPLQHTGGSVAFCKQVGIPQLDVRELPDGRLIIWVRVMNVTPDDIRVEVQCRPNDDPNQRESFEFREIILARDVYRDFSFVISGPKERRFSILVDC